MHFRKHSIYNNRTSKTPSSLRWFFAACLLCINVYSFSQTATATTKQKKYTIGDWIPVDLFVAANTNSKVFFPRVDTAISDVLDIANFTPIDTIKKSGQNEYHQLVNLIAFDTGQIMLPRFQFLVNNSGKIDTVTSEAILVHVGGIQIDTSGDIQPIKDPLTIPYKAREILPYVIGVILLLLLILGAMWYFTRNKKKQPLEEKYLLPPHIWALKEIEKLQKEQLWQSGEVKLYYSRLTDIARTYIELRYKIPAMERTTEELMQSMHKGIIKQSLKKDLYEILSLSDFVKFAKAQPDSLENENALKIVIDFIHKTKITEEKKDTPEKED